MKHDRPNTNGHLTNGSATDWVVLTRNPAMSQALKTEGWEQMREGKIVWTDDFTNLYSALKRKAKSV